jgi:hypothetical protein
MRAIIYNQQRNIFASNEFVIDMPSNHFPSEHPIVLHLCRDRRVKSHEELCGCETGDYFLKRYSHERIAGLSIAKV